MDALLQQAIELAKQSGSPYVPAPGRIAYLLNHGQSGAGNKYEVDRTQSIVTALQKNGSDVICLGHPGRPQSLEVAVTELEGVLRSSRPEKILSVSDAVVALPAWVIAQRLNLPLYIEVRAFPELERDAREPGFAQTPHFKSEVAHSTFVAQHAKRVFTLSAAMKGELARRGVDPDRIELVPIGISRLPDIKPADPAVRARFGVKPGTKVIGCDGRSSALEDLDSLVEACVSLVAQGEAIKLILVGNDPAVSQAIGKAGALQDRTWLIQVRELPDDYTAEFYALIDVLVIPRKPLPVCELVPPRRVAEALAYGKRLVVSDVAALAEYEQSHDAVIGFNANNAVSLAHAILKSLNSPDPKPETRLLYSLQTAPMEKALSSAYLVPKPALAKPKLKHKSGESPSTQFVAPSAQAAEISILGWPEQPPNGKPYVMGIMDVFTAGCFEQEVNLILPRPDNWYALAEKYQPELIFIESAWKGNCGSWQYRVGHYTNKPGQEVAQLCQYARKKGIPTVFWNKEDPVHHDKFMCSAKLVDHILTTDANMKESYQAKTGKSNVHALPFAAQPALHRPAPLSGRKQRACFAGSWYGDRHAERGEELYWLLQAAQRYGLDIFDRNYDAGIFPFPMEYRADIRGSLSYKELCGQYNSYRVFLNVNSVTDSPTMFARRVFELMACGTPIVSTYAKGIEELFSSGAVWLVRNQAEADEAIHTLMTDDAEWRRRSLAGIREVFAEHTYAHRLNDIFELTRIKSRLSTSPSVTLLAEVKSRTELEALDQFAQKQCYRSFRLGIVCPPNISGLSGSHSEQVVLLQPDQKVDWVVDQLALSSLAGWLSPWCQYGEHYLRDLVNASLYAADAAGWAKSPGEDKFAYDGQAILYGTVWRFAEFLKQFIKANPAERLARSDIYLADSDHFQFNTAAIRVQVGG